MDWSEISTEFAVELRLWRDAMQERRMLQAMGHAGMLSKLAFDAVILTSKAYHDDKKNRSL